MYKKMYKNLILLICFVSLLGVAGNVSASDFWWVNLDPCAPDDPNHLWEDPCNWNGADISRPGEIPTSSDTAGIEQNICLVDSNTTAVCSELRGPGWLQSTFEAPNVPPVLNITGGTLTIGGFWRIAMYGTSIGTVNMSGGTVTVAANAGGDFVIGLNGNGSNGTTGTLNMTGGTIEVTGYIHIPWDDPTYNTGSTGRLNLDGGTITTTQRSLMMAGGGSIDINDGVLILPDDQQDDILQYVSNGWITAYNDNERAILNLDYDITNPGKTTLSASMPGPNQAWGPNPSSLATDVNYAIALISWNPGDSANLHDVYFGTDYDQVNDANNSLPVGSSVYKGNQPLADVNYAPGPLELGKTCYWRIDEVNGLDIWKGDVWQFTAIGYLLVDDFESDANTADLRARWQSNAAASVELETTVINNGAKAMKFVYDNNTSPFYAEAVRTYAGTENWKEKGVKALTLFFHGDPCCAPEQMYARIEDADGNSAKLTYYDPNDLIQQDTEPWREWNMVLQQFNDLNDVNLVQVKKVAIGFDRSAPPAGGTGTVYFDDIRRYPPRCIPFEGADFTGDCDCDSDDLEVLVRDWLDSDVNVAAAAPAQGPVLWYKFDETSGYYAIDSSASGLYDTNDYRGMVNFSSFWTPGGGYDGSGCLRFTTNVGPPGCVFVDVPWEYILPLTPFDRIDKEITISMWVNGDEDAQPQDEAVIFHGTGVGSSRTLLSHCPWVAGAVIFDAGNGTVGGSYDRAYWANARAKDYEGQWNHYAFVKNADEGIQRIYRNGEIVAQNLEAFEPMGGIEDFAIGAYVDGTGGGYTGYIDDFRIYDYALSQPEIVSLAGLSEVEQPLLSPADATGDGKVKFDDFAVMATKWLDEVLWPF